MIKNLGHRVPLTDVASIPVKEEPRDIPVISTNVVRIPQDYATIDEALIAMAEQDAVIALDGTVFTDENPALSPTHFRWTKNVRLTSQDTSVPAVISNITQPTVWTNIFIDTTTPLTIVIDHLKIVNTRTFVDRYYNFNFVAFGPHDIYVDHVVFQTPGGSIYTQMIGNVNNNVGSQVQVTNCSFGPLVDFYNDEDFGTYVSNYGSRGTIVIHNNTFEGQKDESGTISMVCIKSSYANIDSIGSYTNNKTIEEKPVVAFTYIFTFDWTDQKTRIHIEENQVESQFFVVIDQSNRMDAFSSIALVRNQVKHYRRFLKSDQALVQMQPRASFVKPTKCVLMARDNSFDIDLVIGEDRFTDYYTPASEPTKLWNVNRAIEDGSFKFAAYSIEDLQDLNVPLVPFADSLVGGVYKINSATSKSVKDIKRSNKTRMQQQSVSSFAHVTIDMNDPKLPKHIE